MVFNFKIYNIHTRDLILIVQSILLCFQQQKFKNIVQ